MTAASLLGWASTGYSAPIVWEFTATIVAANDYFNPVPSSLLGQTITGSITIERSAGLQVNSSGPQSWQIISTSSSGCSSTHNGVCTFQNGTSEPVVTAYELNTPVGAFGRASSLSKEHSQYEETQSIHYTHRNLMVTSHQSTYDVTSNGPELYSEYRMRELLLHGDYPQQDWTGVYSALLPQLLEFENIDFSRTCNFSAGWCTENDYREGSIRLWAEISDIREMAVPEPGGVALTALGLLALVRSRRARRST